MEKEQLPSLMLERQNHLLVKMEQETVCVLEVDGMGGVGDGIRLTGRTSDHISSSRRPSGRTVAHQPAEPCLDQSRGLVIGADDGEPTVAGLENELRHSHAILDRRGSHRCASLLSGDRAYWPNRRRKG